MHRLTDHLGWERPLRSSPTTEPALPSPPINRVPKHHIHTNVYLFIKGRQNSRQLSYTWCLEQTREPRTQKCQKNYNSWKTKEMVCNNKYLWKPVTLKRESSRFKDFQVNPVIKQNLNLQGQLDSMVPWDML